MKAIMLFIFILLTPSLVLAKKYSYLQSVTPTSAQIGVFETSSGGGNKFLFKYAPADNNVDFDFVITESSHLYSLLPDTSYLYEVEGSNGVVASGEFSTPAINKNFSFAVVGDSGCGCEIQYEIANLIQEMNPSFILHTGDVVYSKGELGNYENKFFKPYEKLIKNLPLYPVIGNHDAKTNNAEPYLKIFQKERYYSFEYGNAIFIALDSTTSFLTTGSPQYEWLKNTLSNSLHKWKVVFFHHPVYSADSKGDGGDVLLRQSLSPLFEEYGVDVVFNGHAHNYQRFTPVNNVTYIVTGGGGGSKNYLRNHPLLEYGEVVPHFLNVEIISSQLVITAINDKGEKIDNFIINKQDDENYTAFGCGGIGNIKTKIKKTDISLFLCLILLLSTKMVMTTKRITN